MEKVHIIGGDDRTKYAADFLEASGMETCCWGVPGRTDDFPGLVPALEGAERVLLPLGAFRDDCLVIGEERLEVGMIPYILGTGATVAAGSFPAEVEGWFSDRGVHCAALLEQESFLQINARITAEGALFLVMREMEKTIFDTNILVIGWGRIGKPLAEMLHLLGAKVTCAVRKPWQDTVLQLEGIESQRTSVYEKGLETYDLIVNTVPTRIMSLLQCLETRKNCIFMELASGQGGFPSELSRERRVLDARGLPGKTAPETAGKALGRAFLSCCLGEGRTLE